MVRLQLLIKAEKLPSAPPKSHYSWKPRKSPNAFCVVSNVSEVGSVLGIKRHLLGTTEVVPQCSSPEWATVILLNHTPGTEHRIAIDVFHSLVAPPSSAVNNNIEDEISSVHGSSSSSSSHRAAMTTQQQHKIEHSERRGHLHVDNAQQLCGILLDVETILSHRDCVLTERLGTAATTSHSTTVTVRLEASVPTPPPPPTDNAVTNNKGGLFFMFHLRGLDFANTRRNFLDRPDFCFEIRRKQRGKTQDTWALVYRSNVARATLNPYWDQDVVSLETLCNYNLEREIQISVWDVPSRTLLGWCNTTIRGLVGAVSERGNAEKSLEIIKPSEHSSSLLHSTTARLGKLVVLKATTSSSLSSSSHLSTVTTGTTTVTTSTTTRPTRQPPPPVATAREESLSNLPQAVAVEILTPPPPSRIRQDYTFQDYRANGKCTLELCVAIDFSRANGDCQLEGTPHYRSSESGLNDYEWAMSVVAESVRDCNPQEQQQPQIPLWGFGAKFHGTPQHIFQCGESPRVIGSRGLLKAYRTTFSTRLEFGYETRYDKVIQAAAHSSKKQLDVAQKENGLAYTVLLILTVGTERDILAAKDQIEAVSAAPLSIIFFRIDNGMHSSPLKTSNGTDERCSMLEGSDFMKQRDARAFREAMLQRIWPQMTNYFVSRGIPPP